ncbi:MAG: DUF1538 domain-containing protein [Sphaerochaetaceae bacterium]
MDLLRKLRETSMSVLPIVAIVIILNVTIAPIGWKAIGNFSLGAVAIIIGLALFLQGIDISIISTGHLIGAKLMEKRNLPLLVGAGFFIGMFVTVADPQVNVFAQQVSSLASGIAKTPLIWAFGIGVGFFAALSFARVVLKVSFRWLIIIFYSLMVITSLFVDPFFLGVAFDAGGATTGPLSVPLIIALGVGVSSVRKSSSSEEDSFGLVGIMAVGPIAAILVMGLIGGNVDTTAAAAVANEEILSLGGLFVHTIIEAFWALLPLLILFLIFQFTLLFQQKRQSIRMVEGLIYVAIGLILFLVGVNGAFMPVGSAIGSLIGSSDYRTLLIPIGFFFGGVIVLAEPAVWVLTDQVNEVSGGAVKKSLILIFFSLGISVAVALAMVRIIFDLSLFQILIPGYIIAMVLSFFSPPLFTAIAYDSGTVASGPMSTSFLLAFTLGVSTSGGGDPFLDGFGVIALIVMTPMISLQLLGLIYRYQSSKKKKGVLVK